MHQVTIHEAKTNLSKLIQEALMGEEVIIAKGKHPLIKLEVLPGAVPKRRIGGIKGLVVKIGADFDEPLDDFSEYVE
ncbi:MAG: type II toxin-antitoxin system prevent-host-death family antitoxin [Proteobacteria bacterium]|nr:type II toxin-antitoxin system prevent-host-death family antitoxin [Pseudomonadota bacterium]